MSKPTCTMHDERYRNAPLVGQGYTLCTCLPVPVMDLAGFAIDQQPGCPGSLVHACGWEIEVGAYCHNPIPLANIVARAQQHWRDGCKHADECECGECCPVCGCVACKREHHL